MSSNIKESVIAYPCEIKHGRQTKSQTMFDHNCLFYMISYFTWLNRYKKVKPTVESKILSMSVIRVVKNDNDFCLEH